jgi:tetratricopeptide (TPR) repeat protein
MLSVRNPPESERCFRLVARIRPNMALAHLRLGELSLEQRRLDEAKSEFLEANRIEPENARALLGLALVAFAEGNFDQARDRAERSFERDPEQRTTAELLLRIFHRLGDEQAAQREQMLLDRMPAGERGWDDPFTEKMLLMRRDPTGLAQAADELIVKGRLPEAIRMLEQLVKSAPETPQWTVMLVRTLNHAGNYRRSAQVLDTALGRHPDSADLQFQRGVVNLFLKEWEPGAARFRKAIELKPDFSDAWFNLGQSLRHLDDRAGAIAAFREAIRFKPDYAAAYANLGELLLDAGENDAAREALETAARLSPGDAGIKRSLERLRM